MIKDKKNKQAALKGIMIMLGGMSKSKLKEMKKPKKKDDEDEDEEC